MVALVLWGVGVFLGPPWASSWASPHPCADPREERRRDSGILEVSCSRDSLGRGPLTGPARLLFGIPLDLNGATAGDLESLPGIGPGRARAIAQARCEERFDGLPTLERVRGIGPRTVEGLSGWAVAREVPNCPASDGNSPK
jgi:hypothetical protein